MRYNDQFKKLDDVGFIGRGKSKHRPRNDESLYGGNYPFVQTGDVRKAEYYLTEYSQTYNDKGLAQSKLWNEGTLCITIAANIAETAVLGIKACFPDSIIGFIPDEKKADVRFIKYCLETYKIQMQSISQGATQDNLSLEKLRSINFSIPELKIQQDIAEVLYSYDKLIENNTKRISILEQMAEQFYKEWFVRMRFPGYENTKFVKGIPEGWELTTLGSVTNILMGQSPKSEFYNDKGIGLPFHQGVGTYGEVFPNHETYCSVSGREAKKGDILFSVRAPVGRLNIADRNLIIGRGLSAMSHKENKNSFLWELLKYSFMKEDIIGNGAIFNSVGKKELYDFKFIYPPIKLINDFEEVIKPIHTEVKTLYEQIDNLRKTRDFLLPRLISGNLQIKTKRKEVLTDQKAVTPFYQKQILAHIIKKQEEYNMPQGEMVLAKNAYLLEALYGVNTGFNWKNWHYGTYDGKIRQLINGRDKFFAKKEVGNSGFKVLVLGENKEKVLSEKYNHPILDDIDNAMDELLEIYSKYPVGKERSHKIELLNTTVKCIVDTKSINEEIIIQAFREWKTPKADSSTKADKFNESEIKSCIDFIVSKKWDKKLKN
jgi:type I restriction enzyme S subunit